MSSSREPNIDLIRASAIGLVLVHHIGQFLPQVPELGHRYLKLGAYGVDLFFVLSGWLIGRLYWLEKQQSSSSAERDRTNNQSSSSAQRDRTNNGDSGTVHIWRFWVRRWLRTIPPYLAILPVAFAGVYFFRKETFDWRYLLFLQNYQDQIPFFSISWSLCVEEHFYLFLPILLWLITRLKLPMQVAMPALVLISFMTRFLDPAALPEQAFGYPNTATHLRLEGLIMGVWFAYLSVFSTALWARFQRVCKWLLAPLLLGFLTMPFWSSWSAYYLGYGYVALVFSAALATLTAMPALAIAKQRATYYLALTSYSIYLSHSILLSACIMVTDKLGINRTLASPVWLALILLCGYITYLLVEKPSIALRERIAPKQQKTRLTV